MLYLLNWFRLCRFASLAWFLIFRRILSATAFTQADVADAHGFGFSHPLIAKFVQRLYAGTVFCKRRLSLAQAHDEAIALLEQAYAQMGDNGYDDAVLDAADPSHEGLQVVLAMMAEWIKAHRRETYRHWVLARHIDPSDWRAKCAIAKILIDHWREWMPPELCRLSLGQLTDAIPELLSIHLATNDPSRSFSADSSDQC